MNKEEMYLKELLSCFLSMDTKIKLPNEVDPEALWELMKRQGVALSFDHYVQFNRAISLSNKLNREANEEAYYRMFREMSSVFRNLEGKGIPYVVTKGMYTALLGYPRSGDRLFNDIDLLIDAMDEEEAISILISQGFLQGVYSREKNVLIPIPRQNQIFFSAFTHQTAPFRKALNNFRMRYMTVDVNHHILWGECMEDFKSLSIRDFITHRKPMEYAGVKFWGLLCEYGFIHIALHLYNDLNSLNILHTAKSYNLRGFLDAYLFIKNNDLDWAVIEEYCAREKLSKYVYYVLTMTGKVFNDESLQYLIKRPVDYTSDFENSFGLHESERRLWRHTLWERIFSPDREVLLAPYLQPADIAKINYNNKFIQLGV